MSVKEILVELNSNYSGVLSLLISVLTAITTIIYVVITNKQVKITKISLEQMEKHFKLNNQPCIIPKITSTEGSKCFYKTRRQLHINLDIENVGDSPALCVYTVGYLKLKHIQNDGSDIVDMYYLPDYISKVSINQVESSSIRFETKEIRLLIKDLEVNYRLNMERIATDASISPFKGTDLVIKVFYKNIVGQWFESTLTQEIAWLINTSENNSERKTNSLNEVTIPPKELYPDTSFELQLVSERLSPVEIRIIELEQVKETIERYKDDMPSSYEILKKADETEGGQ